MSTAGQLSNVLPVMMSATAFERSAVALDVGRRVARADAVGWLAGAVGGPHETEAPGRKHDRHLAAAHQLPGSLERDRGHPVDRALRGARPNGRLGHHLRHATDRPDRRRMGAEDDGAPCLQADKDLVDRGGCWIRRRHDRRDHAEGLGDLDHALGVESANHADGAHRPDEAIDRLGREQVLHDLVRRVAVAGLLDRHSRERHRLLGGGGRRRVHDPVDLVLGQLGEPRLGGLGPPRAGAGVPNRVEVPIGRCGGFGHSHQCSVWVIWIADSASYSCRLRPEQGATRDSGRV